MWILLTLRQAGHTHFTPGNWFVHCVVPFLLLWTPSYILSLTPYFLLEQSESVLTKCAKSKDYRAKIKGGYRWLGLLGWQHAAFTSTWGTLNPALSSLSSPGSALTCLTSPTATCQDQHPSSRRARERRGPAEYFDTTPPLRFRQQGLDQNNSSGVFLNWCNHQSGQKEKWTIGTEPMW